MRDETKSALILAAILASFTLVTKFLNPGVWNFVMHPAPITAPPDKGLAKGPDADKDKDRPPTPARFDDFVALYGPPTLEERSEQNKLHPPMATRWLDYEPEHIRVAFVAADTGEQPPRREWTAISFMDSLETRPITASAAAVRLRNRRK